MELQMFRIKLISLFAVAALLSLAACSDISGPEPTDFCPIGGGPGTCVVQR